MMNSSRSLLRLATRSNLTRASYRFKTTSTAHQEAGSTDLKQPQRIHSNVDEHREAQKSRPLNPHMTNTNSTFNNEVPSVGADKAPPDMISLVDENYVPTDRVPENTERMTGGTQSGNPDKVSFSELGVGEMEGAEFKVEPLRRTGEDSATMRARLLYQSRKRGTLESDLLLSTFAAEYLPKMSKQQMEQYDRFMDENDWDIYYWATQTEAGTPTSLEYAEGAVSNTSPSTDTQYNAPADPSKQPETDAWRQGAPRSGEWAQTVGTFKPAYRPVPSRWEGSEIIKMLRIHVAERSAGGINSELNAKPSGKGMGRMPNVQVFDS